MSKFVHHELNTSDPKAAKAFYKSLFGWKYQDMPMPGGTYTMVTNKDGEGIGGIQEHPMPGAPSHWLGYVEVDSVDKAIGKVVKLGGQILVPKTEAGGMGELAVFADPTGAVFAVWRSFAPAPKKAAKKRTTKKKKAAKKRTTKKKPAKKRTTKKKAAKKRTTKKKAAKKRTTKKKAAKKRTTKKKAAKKRTTKKRTTKKAAKKRTTKKRPAKKATKKRTAKKATKKRTAKKAAKKRTKKAAKKK